MASKIAAALDPDPPKKKKSMLSSFITDTLFRAAGGPFRIENKPESEAPIVWNGIPAAAGTTYSPDTTVTFWGPMSDHDIAHETGHMVDRRGLAEDAMLMTDAYREFYPNQGDYWSHNQREYIAEAFARAIQSGRGGFADSAKVETEMPGAIHLIRWLQTRPPFKK